MSRFTYPNLTIFSVAALVACIACAEVDHVEGAGERALRAQREPLNTVTDTPLTFASANPVTLSRHAPMQAFTFELSGNASLYLHTAFDASGVEVDTVILLYRARKHGWGPVIASSDDFERSRFSAIARDLPEGRYRLQVKGFKRSNVGSFVLNARCSGAGCPVAPARCIFGGTYHELRDGGAFERESTSVLTEDDIAALSALQQAQLLAAVQVAYEDAADLTVAMSSVDQNEVNRLLLRELTTGRSFTAYEYGAGDNSYGAVFESESAEIAAQIQDGDLYACRVLAP